MRIDLIDDRFVATCKFEDRDRLHKAGFVFDRLITRKWYTKDWRKASIFLDNLSDDAYWIVKDKLDKHEAELSASYSMFAEADIPKPHLVNHKGEVLDYLPYQKAGILYAAERYDTLIADAPGLGKTIQTIGLINHLGITDGLIVCPSSLKINWQNEMEKWLVNKGLSIEVCYGDKFPKDANFVIINYDILNRNRDILWERHWGLLTCDEAQYLSNDKSNRTQTVFGEWFLNRNTGLWQRKKITVKEDQRHVKVPGMIRAERRLMLTGTPMMKRPKDLWPIIRDFDPDGLGKDFVEFAFRYCDGYEGSFGLVADGGSNLDELNERLRKTFMVRRLKSNVLKDLPPKTRQVIVLSPEGLKKKINTERDKFTDSLAMLAAANDNIVYNPKVDLAEVDPGVILDASAKILGDGFNATAIEELDPGEVEPGFAAYSQARHELALSKVPMAVEHIKRLVEAGEKVIVFAIHKDVVQDIYDAFPTAARIIGGLSTKKVEAEKLRFQGDKDKGIEPDPACNVIICNLKAGGVGHTLTEATVVVFVEMWSVPGDMEQCEDRAHRIGLEHNVLVQYLVVDGTMDALTIQTLIARIEMIGKAVDGVDPVEMRKAA